MNKKKKHSESNQENQQLQKKNVLLDQDIKNSVQTADRESNKQKASEEDFQWEDASSQKQEKESSQNGIVTVPKSPKKKKKHVALWICSGLVALLLLGYFGMAFYFQSHFLPNTSVNDVDCSYRTAQEAAELLSTKNLEYQLEVDDRDGNTIGIITATDIDLTIVDVLEGTEELLRQQNVLTWILAFRNPASKDFDYGVTFDSDQLMDFMGGWEAMDNSKTKAPENAYISEYSQKLKGYEIIPEKEGTHLDHAKVQTAVENALQTQESKINLGDAECYQTAEITSDDVNLVKKLETLNKWTSTQITYDWNGTEVILDGDTIHEWIVEDGNSMSLDEDAVGEFVAQHAKENDTYGKKRKFLTTLGEELTLPSGAYGWKTDRASEKSALLELIQEGSVSEREPEYLSRGAKKGKEDIGSSYVECDLTNQHLYLYQDGKLILETDFVSGNMSISGRMTPPGVFGLTYKTKNAVLRGEDYETPVKYWMPFNGNVGMHDASWRRSFGGDIFITGGSHGCVNLPPSMAAQIYEYVSTGFPVICYYY